MNPLPVQRASALDTAGPQTQWLVEGLWTEQAVGILGGEPKCCKSFLALDLAVSVASGKACLRHFLCGMRTSVVCDALAELSDHGLVSHDDRGYQLKLPFDDPLVSLPIPIAPGGNGNGNGKRHVVLSQNPGSSFG